MIAFAPARRPRRSFELPPDLAEANALAAMRRPGELYLLAALLACYLPVYLLDAAGFYPLMNVIGPLALAAILGWSCYGIVKQNPIAVWAPLFWFRLSCAIYYGFGATIPHVVNQETLDHIYRLYYFDAETNLKVNFISTFGIFLVLLFSSFFLRNRSRRFRSGPALIAANRPSNILVFAFAFLLVGGVMRYGFVLPDTFGLTDTLLPGMVRSLSRMYYVGIYLLIVHVMNGNRKFLTLAVMLIGFEITVSVASFAKSELLLILIFSFLGFISRNVGKTKVLIGASCVLFAYFAFQPLVGYGRDQLVMRYGEIRGAGLVERWDIVQDYLAGARRVYTRQGGLSRLSYLNVGAYVVDKYDAGLPGDTLRNAAAVFVPRILWPDKPIITSLGPELNFEIFGREGSSLGIGHFAEAYWNFGWIGMAPFMCILALILSMFTRFSMRAMARKDWLFLPVVFMGVYMGIRADGFFVPDVLGAGWIALVAGAFLYIAKVMLVSMLGPRRPHTYRAPSAYTR